MGEQLVFTRGEVRWRRGCRNASASFFFVITKKIHVKEGSLKTKSTLTFCSFTSQLTVEVFGSWS